MWRYQKLKEIYMNRKISIGVLIVAVLIIMALIICFYILEEINLARQKLIKITDSNDLESERISKLKELAKRVGAGTINSKFAGVTTHNLPKGGTVTSRHQDPISEAELIQNINNSLQTATMIEMCRVSGNNYIVAAFAAIAAIFSAIAAWVGIKAVKS
jgi:predicted PurR-regulated permease PerM